MIYHVAAAAGMTGANEDPARRSDTRSPAWDFSVLCLQLPPISLIVLISVGAEILVKIKGRFERTVADSVSLCELSLAGAARKVHHLSDGTGIS
jgi:hypothetical protein